MLSPTSAVMGKGLGNEVALITDGRFSGGSMGSWWDTSPRPGRAAYIAIVKTAVPLPSTPTDAPHPGRAEEEIDARLKAWNAPNHGTRGVLAKYASLVNSRRKARFWTPRSSSLKPGARTYPGRAFQVADEPLLLRVRVQLDQPPARELRHVDDPHDRIELRGVGKQAGEGARGALEKPLAEEIPLVAGQQRHVEHVHLDKFTEEMRAKRAIGHEILAHGHDLARADGIDFREVHEDPSDVVVLAARTQQHGDGRVVALFVDVIQAADEARRIPLLDGHVAVHRRHDVDDRSKVPAVADHRTVYGQSRSGSILAAGHDPHVARDLQRAALHEVQLVVVVETKFAVNSTSTGVVGGFGA